MTGNPASSSVLLPNKRFEHGLFHGGRLLLPGSPFFGFLPVFENSVAGCLAVIVRDDHTLVLALGFLLIFAVCGHGGNFTISLAAPYCIRPSPNETYSSTDFPVLRQTQNEHQLAQYL